jgi:putative membrane protein
MFEARRQHPVAAVTGALKSLREMLIPLVIVLFVGTGSESQAINMAIALIFIGFLFVLGTIRWLRFTYRVEDDELRIEHGLLVRKKKYIPKERIQVIDVRAGIIQRMFGLVSISVQTAGDNQSGAEINALTREDAARLQELLNGHRSKPESPGDVPFSKDADTSAGTGTEAGTGEFVHAGMRPGDRGEESETWSLTVRHLIIAATTAGSFGIALSIIGTIFSQVQQGIDEEEMAAYMERFIFSAGQFWVTIIFGLIVLAWLLSFFGTLIRFYNFRLIRNKQGLIVQSGLFEQKQVTIPYRRIQAIRIVEGILRQPFGYATIYLESAGYGDEAGNRSTIIVPLIRKREIPDLVRKMLPEFEVSTDAVRPPRRARFRFLFRGVRPILLFLVIPAIIFLELGYFPLLLLPFGVWLGIQRYRDAAAGIAGHTVVIRSRALALTTAIIRKRRIQSADLVANPFQRRLDLTSFTVTVASGDSGQPFTAQDLDNSTAGEFFHWAMPGDYQPEIESGALYLPAFDEK